MPIDLRKEAIFTLAEAVKVLPKLSGKRLDVSTVWRWCSRGLGGVRLEHVRVGRRICTSTEALYRFLNRPRSAGQVDLSRDEDGPPSNSEKSRLKAADACMKLDEEGFGNPPAKQNPLAPPDGDP